MYVTHCELQPVATATGCQTTVQYDRSLACRTISRDHSFFNQYWYFCVWIMSCGHCFMQVRIHQDSQTLHATCCLLVHLVTPRNTSEVKPADDPGRFAGVIAPLIAYVSYFSSRQTSPVIIHKICLINSKEHPP